MHTISLQAGVTPSSTIYMLLILMHCETCNHQVVVYKMFYKMKIVKLWHLTCSRHQSLQIFEFQFSKSYLVAPAKAASKQEGPKKFGVPDKKAVFLLKEKRLLFCREPQIFLVLLVLKWL